MNINNSNNIDREEYEQELQKRQKQHLENVGMRGNINWRPCLHDSCTNCNGTGITLVGGSCVHMISCPCPKCTPSYF